MPLTSGEQVRIIAIGLDRLSQLDGETQCRD